MIQLYPNSLLHLDNFFRATPLLYYIQQIRNMDSVSMDYSNDCNEILILRVLIESCPESLIVGDAAGLIPLHMSGINNSVPYIKA